MINESRFGHVKGSNEFSIYGFGVKSNTLAGPAEKYDRQITEIDAHYVIPPATNEAEVQISITITNQYLNCPGGPVKRSINMLAGMALKPADAEKLAIALAPQLSRPALKKDELVYIQSRAPNGDWIDRIGIPGGADNPDLHASLKYERDYYGHENVRVVRKYIEVLDL